MLPSNQLFINSAQVLLSDLNILQANSTSILLSVKSDVIGKCEQVRSRQEVRLRLCRIVQNDTLRLGEFHRG